MIGTCSTPLAATGIMRMAETLHFRHCWEVPMTRVFSAARLSSALVPLGVAVLAAAPAAQARVTQITIAETEQPAYGGKSFGTVGV
jgi:hypothetical protein